MLLRLRKVMVKPATSKVNGSGSCRSLHLPPVETDVDAVRSSWQLPEVNLFRNQWSYSHARAVVGILLI